MKVMEQKLQTEKSKQSNFDKFGGKIELKNRMSISQRKESKGMSDHQKHKENINPQHKKGKNIESIDLLSQQKYKDHEYVPMHSSEGDSYRRYMQYHLRNNILDILSKKSGTSLAKENKYIYMTKSQGLINKRPASVLSNKVPSQTKIGEINKTFR